MRNNFYLNWKKYIEIYRSYTASICYIKICITLQKKLYSSVYSKIKASKITSAFQEILAFLNCKKSRTRVVQPFKLKEGLRIARSFTYFVLLLFYFILFLF